MDKNSKCEMALTWTHEVKERLVDQRLSTIDHERCILGWNSWNEARRVAADRTSWRKCTSALLATGPEEDR